jgi:hypothetical protein
MDLPSKGSARPAFSLVSFECFETPSLDPLFLLPPFPGGVGLEDFTCTATMHGPSAFTVALLSAANLDSGL